MEKIIIIRIKETKYKQKVVIMNNKKLKVAEIENGTVIDHIQKGKALLILEILRIIGTDKNDDTLLVLVNVHSDLLGKKDIIKIENRELTSKEIDAIALIAPKAKINIIKDFKIIEKREVELPDKIEGIAKCANPNCITNTNEPVPSKFRVLKEDGKDPILRCEYCEQTTKIEEGVLNLFK